MKYTIACILALFSFGTLSAQTAEGQSTIGVQTGFSLAGALFNLSDGLEVEERSGRPSEVWR